MVEVHVGRQPIYCPDRSVHGFELLFRASADADRASMRADEATTAVILASVLEFGLERLTAPHPAFLNITRAFAVGELPLPFPTQGVVLELLEDVPVDAEVERGVRRLSEQGFSIALDDFEWDQDRLGLLPVADYVKIDIEGKSASELCATTARLSEHGVATVAERIETAEDLQICLDAGFDLLQGYHLLRPAVLSASSVEPASVHRLRLLERLCSPDVSLPEVEDLVAADTALSYRLLQAVRSVAAGVPQEVDSLSVALVLLGMDRVRAWVTLMALAPAGGDDQGVQLAVTRGRFCQVLARRWPGVSPGAAFLVGVLSGLQLVMPGVDVVGQLPLTSSMRAAQTDRSGPLGHLLAAVESYQAGATAVTLSQAAGDLPRSYLASLTWCHDLLAKTRAA